MKSFLSKLLKLITALGVCFIISFAFLMYGDGWSLDMFVPTAFGLFGIYCLYMIINPDKDLNKEKTEITSTNKIQNYSFQPEEYLSTFIAGVTFEDRQSLIKNLRIGDTIELIPEPQNQFDQNAIQVVTLNNHQSIGYLPKDLASHIKSLNTSFKIPGFSTTGIITNLSNQGTDHMGVNIKFRIPK